MLLKLLAVVFLSTTCIISKAQKGTKKDGPAYSAVRGYYKTLQKFSPLPNEIKRNLDTAHYPVTGVDWEKFKSRQPYYLEPKPALIKISPPPANNSLQTIKELEYLVSLQTQRNNEDERTSQYFANIWYNVNIKKEDADYNRFQRNLFHMGRSISTWFNADSLPLTRQLMANLWNDASYFIWYYKYLYARIRPYKLDTRLKNLEETNWAAYPTAHAGNSYVAAFVYSELAPEFSDIFVKDAFDMAHSREIIGVHFPSDSESGRILARQLVDLLLSNQKFIEDFKKAKEEWREVRSRNF